jgi:hypothetical protein
MTHSKMPSQVWVLVLSLSWTKALTLSPQLRVSRLLVFVCLIVETFLTVSDMIVVLQARVLWPMHTVQRRYLMDDEHDEPSC